MQEQYSKIISNRPMIETMVLGTMLKSMTLYGEYKISENDFIYDKTKFYFSLGKAMSKNHRELDQASVLEFVNSNKEFKECYEEHGGWKSIKNLIEYGNENNIRAYIDNLAKNNLLISLSERGFNVTRKMKHNGLEFNPYEELFPNMNCREVEEFYEGLISSCSVGSINNNVKVESLVLRAKDRERLKNKVEAGTPYDIMFSYTEKEIGIGDSEEIRYIYSLPTLSSATKGLGNGDGISILAGFSGIGKSTILYLNFVLPMIYRGERIVVFSNEQKSTPFKVLLTSFIAANIFRNYQLNRGKITDGDYTEDEEIILEKIEKFLDKRDFEDSLKFIHMEEFDVQEIMRISKGMITHEGFSGIFIDTFKSEDSSDAQYTGKVVENAKALDVFGNKYNIKVILSMQLMPSNEMKNAYLTASDISEAKAVKTVSDLLFLMRKVVPELELDETNKKFFLKPYRLRYNPLMKKWEREQISFNEEDLQKDYRLIFLNKSRRGDDDLVVLVKFNGKNGRFEEIGKCAHVHRGQLSY